MYKGVIVTGHNNEIMIETGHTESPVKTNGLNPKIGYAKFSSSSRKAPGNPINIKPPNSPIPTEIRISLGI